MQSAKLIKQGALQLLLWEGYWGCEGWPRCTAEEQFAYELAVAYQPLQFSVVGAPGSAAWTANWCLHPLDDMASYS